jgi:hypothetical protein
MKTSNFFDRMNKMNGIACMCEPLSKKQPHPVHPVILSLLWFLFGVLMSFSASAQIQQAWVARYNNGITNGTNQAVKMALDPARNIYVTGFSQNASSNLGYVTIKYAPNGTQLWATRYDSTNCPLATPSGLALDNSNNVIVTGSALTIKYDSNGNQLWMAAYAGTGLAVDTNGNACVTGFGTSFNTVQLNPSGTTLWLNTFPSSCGDVAGQAIVADANGNIYIAGSYPFSCEKGIVDYELLVIKYGANGSQLWTTTYQWGGASALVEGVALDGSGNIYLAVEFANMSPYTVLMWNAGGVGVWTASPSNVGYNLVHALAVDSAQCLLMTGQIPTSYPNGYGLFSYYTLKLGTNGSTLWTALYPVTATATGVANSLALDLTGNCYVTGYSPGSNSGNDIVTIKYGPNGNQVWLERYHGPGNGDDAGNAIAVDNNGNVYVTGYETTAAGGTEIVTIKYSPVALQRRADGTVLLQAQGSPGESFDLQGSTDLLNWLDLGSILADSNGVAQFADTNASNYNRRFYVTTPQ